MNQPSQSRGEVCAATLGDVPEIARVHVDAWRETYPGLLPDFVLRGLSYDERERQWRRALAEGETCLYVARVDGVVPGFAAGGTNRDPEFADVYPGELYAIYLLRAYQGLGLGRSLFAAVSMWLRTQGFGRFLLWAVAENPSCGFYERLGGMRFITRPTEVHGADVDESGYGWNEGALQT